MDNPRVRQIKAVNQQSPDTWLDVRADELNAIAGTVEKMYPSASDALRGIAGNLRQHRPSIMDEAADKEPTMTARIAMLVFAFCLIALMVMGTVKVGMVLFG